jgi:hypothetical protein
MAATYRMTCVACGAPFEARRRDAAYCSGSCQKRAKRGHPASEMPGRDLGHSLPAPVPIAVGFYVLYRGRLDRPEVLPVTRTGEITGGPFAGRTIGEMLRTAAREGWLVFKRMPGSWFAAEWWPERKSIALCGPLGAPPAGVRNRKHWPIEHSAIEQPAKPLGSDAAADNGYEGISPSRERVS